MVAPIFVGREKSIKALEQAFADKSPIILSIQREPSIEDPESEDILRIGTIATVVPRAGFAFGSMPRPSISPRCSSRDRCPGAVAIPAMHLILTGLASPTRDMRCIQPGSQFLVNGALDYGSTVSEDYHLVFSAGEVQHVLIPAYD